MKLIICVLTMLTFALTGCIHHRSSKSSSIRSKGKKVGPKIEKYQEEINKNEDSQKAPKPVPQEKKEEMMPPMDPHQNEDLKKNPSSWWPWD